MSWLQELCHLEDFKVVRCLKPSDLEKQPWHTQVHSAFVMGKARVAPLKSVTVPRLEVIAATMASRIDVLWRTELHMDLQDSVFWTDICTEIHQESDFQVQSLCCQPSLRNSGLTTFSMEVCRHCTQFSRCGLQRFESGCLSQKCDMCVGSSVSYSTRECVAC